MSERGPETPKMDGACLELAGKVPARGARLEAAEESALIRRAQRGDREAFDHLVRIYDQQVLRLAVQVLRSEEEARDLYQEAFLKIYRSLGRFRGDSRFSTWVYRIVMNVCLDHLRRRGRRERQAPESAPGEADFFERVADERPALQPDRALAGKEIGQRIERALKRLSPRERMVFELKHYQGMRLAAIGTMVGTSEEAIKNSLFRATQKLRAELAPLGGVKL